MNTRPAIWGAALGSALALFVVAVALVMSGPGGAPTNGTPTPSGVGHATPGASTGPGTPGPDATPTAQPTPLSTDKVEAPRSVGPQQLTGYGWPLKRPWITSRFAPRDFGTFLVIDGVQYHDGLDLATHCGDEVYATHDGTVLVADRTFDQFLGYKGHPEEIYNRTVRNGHKTALAIGVVIDDGNGYRSQYIHLKEATVVPGQVVRRGDQIGIEGATGAARGCHVHYSLIRMDGGWQAIIPRLWQYGYPEKIREHVNPLDVLPWGDEWAPLRLYNQIHPPSPTPTPASPPPPTATPSPTPTGSPPTPSPSSSPRH
ncbi:MAG TPA: M23 family metallopeptidase [Candidatus Limnocylindrales bacterium]